MTAQGWAESEVMMSAVMVIGCRVFGGDDSWRELGEVFGVGSTVVTGHGEGFWRAVWMMEGWMG